MGGLVQQAGATVDQPFSRLPLTLGPPNRPSPIRLQIAGETVSLVVPCADMANHVLRPNASYAFSPEEDAFVLRALRVRAVCAVHDVLSFAVLVRAAC